MLGASAVIISTGVDYRRLDAPGVEQLTGRGVYYGGSRTEGVSCRDERVVVVGGANSAGQAAIYFSSYAQHVTILCRGGDLGKSMSRYLIDTIDTTDNIDVRLYGEVAEAHGDENLERITVRTRATRAGRHGSRRDVRVHRRPTADRLSRPPSPRGRSSCWPAPSC